MYKAWRNFYEFSLLTIQDVNEFSLLILNLLRQDTVVVDLKDLWERRVISSLFLRLFFELIATIVCVGIKNTKGETGPFFYPNKNSMYFRVSNNRTASIKRTNWKTRFHMTCIEGQFDVVELMVNDQFKTFSINLNAQHVNGMTPFDLAVHMYGY